MSEGSGRVTVEVAVEEGDLQARVSVNLTTSDGSANCKLTHIELQGY